MGKKPLYEYSQIPADAYFIRVANNKKLFIHPNQKGDGYEVQQSTIGAAIFTKDNAQMLIQSVEKGYQLEIVKVSDLLKPDYTFN